MKPPIFIDDNGDLNIFDAVKAAESYIEPEDASKATTRIYDSDGRMLAAIHVPPDNWLARQLSWPGRKMCLVQVDQDPLHASELQEKLKAYLKRFNYRDEQLRDLALNRLVKLAVERC